MQEAWEEVLHHGKCCIASINHMLEQIQGEAAPAHYFLLLLTIKILTSKAYATTLYSSLGSKAATTARQTQRKSTEMQLYKYAYQLC